MTTQQPTACQYNAYQDQYNYFNLTLFAGQLPDVLLVWTRQPRVAGHYAKDRWERSAGGGSADEIALNPILLGQKTLVECASTIVHEMCHLAQAIELPANDWRPAAGKASRPGYHNQQFADLMEAVGLTTSNTGQPGGARVGQQMSDYPTPNGRFLVALENLPESAKMPWRGKITTMIAPQGAAPEIIAAIGEEATGQSKPTAAKSKVKYSCPSCRAKAWGKPELKLICGDCMQPMEGR